MRDYEMKPDPLMFISEVKDYLYRVYQVRRNLRAIQYWTSHGLLVKGKRVYLRIDYTYMAEQYTRPSWVDDFIWKVSRK